MVDKTLSTTAKLAPDICFTCMSSDL